MSKSSFKVGDRIRIYGTDKNFEPVSGISYIETIVENGMFYIVENDSVADRKRGIDLTMAHPKACRRLKKQKCSECGR